MINDIFNVLRVTLFEMYLNTPCYDKEIDLILNNIHILLVNGYVKI